MKKWSTRDDKLVADEERELAKKLYDDFARFTTLDVLEAAVVKQTGSDSILNLGRHGDMSSGRYISVFSLELHGGGDRTTLSVQVPRVDMSGPANKPSGDNGGPPGAAPANNTGTTTATATGAGEGAPSSSAPTYKVKHSGTGAQPVAPPPPPPKATPKPPSKPTDPILAAKAEGNSFYGQGKLHKAIRAYSRAITVATDKPQRVPGDYGTVVSALYANRAAAYLRRSKAAHAKVVASKQDLQDCLRDCDRALDLRPGYFKVLYRRAQALLHLGRLHEAQADIDVCVEVATASRAAAGGDGGGDCDDAMFAEVCRFQGSVARKLASRAKATQGVLESVAAEDEALAGSVLDQLLHRTDGSFPAVSGAASEPVRPPAGQAAEPSAGAAAGGGTSSLPANTKSLADLARELDAAADAREASAGGGGGCDGASGGDGGHGRVSRRKADRDAARGDGPSIAGVGGWRAVAVKRAKAKASGKAKAKAKAASEAPGGDSGTSDTAGSAGVADKKAKLGPRKAARLLKALRSSIIKGDMTAAASTLGQVQPKLYPKLFGDAVRAGVLGVAFARCCVEVCGRVRPCSPCRARFSWTRSCLSGRSKPCTPWQPPMTVLQLSRFARYAGRVGGSAMVVPHSTDAYSAAGVCGCHRELPPSRGPSGFACSPSSCPRHKRRMCCSCWSWWHRQTTSSTLRMVL